MLKKNGPKLVCQLSIIPFKRNTLVLIGDKKIFQALNGSKNCFCAQNGCFIQKL